ncbi:4909_t:CDS:2, partial [Paraglomus occultum]
HQQELIDNNDDGQVQILENGEIWSAEDFRELKDVEKRFELVWKEDALKNKRVYYDSTSRTTQWRKRKAEEELKRHVHSFAKIDTFFQPLTLTSSALVSTSAFTSLLPSSFFPDLQACLEDLSNCCKILKSNKFYDTYDEKKKDVFYDGHERSDVVQYRKEWLKRMFNYKQLMKDYNGEMLDEIIEPQLQPDVDEKEHVIVTHDESHFYANEGQRKLWIQDKEDVLRPKYQGRSIMVSDFLCACHGSLQLTDEQLEANPHVKFKDVRVLRSIQADGYWKAEHMIEQLINRAIPIFEIIHPGCIGVFCFDQSTNHNAMAEDALVVTRLNLGPGKKQAKLRDGKPKGIQTVLTERGLWPAERIRLVCTQCSEQKSALEEVIIASNHICEKYPKFHCECNFIERYWGYAKRETRRRCSYKYDDLVKVIPEVLNSIPITTIRKFARKSWRYMDAYDKGLEGRMAEWAVKKYKSHRRLPDNVNEFFE